MCRDTFDSLAKMQKWPSLQVIGSILGLLCWICLFASFKVGVYSRFCYGRLIVFLCVVSLKYYPDDGGIFRSYGQRGIDIGVLSAAVNRHRWQNTLLSRPIYQYGGERMYRSNAFIHREDGVVTSTKYRQCNVASKTKADESSADGSSKNGDSAIVTEEPTSTKVTLSPNGFTFKRRYTGNKRLTPKMLKGPLTIADVIRRRMIPQPPSLKETQKVLERKPWKRLGIPKLIKQEKERIEETDEFLDNYFYTYLANRGTDSGLSCGVKNIDQSLFKRKSKATENNQSIVNSADESANGYNVDELLKMWDTKGGHFYTNIPKTVAMLQIVWRMANQSKADKETIKRIGEHVCFHRLVGSVVRHMRYMSRIELPKHLKNYKKLVDMVPRFNKEQMVTIFTVLAYFEFKDERVVNAMLKYTEQYHDITPDELRTIILSCLKMKVDPSHMMEDYITKVKVEHKENSGPERGEVEKLEYYLEVLRTCSILDYMDNELFTHIAEMFKKVENIPLVVVTKAVWLFTNVQHLDEELYQHLYSILIRHLKEIKGKRIVSTLIIWLGCCHYKPPRELVDHLGKMLLSDIESYNLWELTSAIRNLTLMDCYNDDLYKHVLNMELFMKPPSVKVLQQINLQLNQEKSAYAAYLHPTASSDLSVAFSKLYQSYLGYQYLSSSPNKIQLPKDAQNKLKDIHVAGAKNGALTSSAFHIQVKDILKEAFGIDCKVDYITEDGFVVDIAILPSSLAKHTTGINAKDFLIDKKLAIELHGPYHYLQKSTGQFPPPLNNSVLYKTRILNARGWEVAHLDYWSIVPWMKDNHKARVLRRVLPQWIKNVCNITNDNQTSAQIAPS